MATIGKQKFNPNSTIKSFPLLAIEQWERLILSHNVEFRGGFYMNQTGINGDVKELYIPDSREVFCNTCMSLAFLIRPVLNKKTEIIYDEIIEELKELEKKFLDATTAEETIVLGEAFYEGGDKILLEQYNNMRVKIYQKLFLTISYEFQYHRYWKTGTTDD